MVTNPIRWQFFCYWWNSTLKNLVWNSKWFNKDVFFYQKVGILDTSDILCELDLDRATELFHLKLIDTYKETCPIKTKTLSAKDQKQPWISSAIKNEHKKETSLFSLYRRNLISNHEVNNFRNFVTNQIRSTKKKTYFHKFSKLF